MLPKTLKDAIFSADGVGYAGRADITQFPKLARKMEEYQTGGMSGPIEIDLGSEKLEMEVELTDFDADLMRQFGAFGVAGIGFRLNGSLECDDDDCTNSAVEILARGRLREVDQGGYSPGEMAKTKYSIALSAFKYTVDNQIIIEIDNANYIFVVNGKDILEHRRKNLKL